MMEESRGLNIDPAWEREYGDSILRPRAGDFRINVRHLAKIFYT